MDERVGGLWVPSYEDSVEVVFHGGQDDVTTMIHSQFAIFVKGLF